ncbi:sugar ABC transporter permease [Jatrophihabitans telluris]|uniref:Sugar ABC transporter permease n=1 Tax=Jatrophihabitans telluris TaxID=2038343 RepID=A0ABY4QYY5_9ACTN|nr:sugar ABC transporter permease [Jatrophihabitans telluris]UQX88417.1 sugar ABC transporter permease [Jatrophihabitans telluris]
MPVRKRSRLPREWWVGYLLIAPFFLLFAAFTAYPMIYALELSFSDWHGAGVLHWIGWSNYTYLLTNADFWASLGNSAVMWLLIVPVQTIGAIAVASALTRSRLRFKKTLRVVVILPYVTPLAAMAQAFILIFDNNFGVVNTVLGWLSGPSVGWLTTTTWAKPTIALFVLWKTSGFALIIMLSAVQGIPTDVYEASAIDGAGAIRTFLSVTVPLVRRTIGFFIVVSTLGISQMFLEPYVLTRGGPYNSSTTSGLYLYNHISASDLGTGAANSFLLVVLVFLLSLFAVRVLRSKED